MSATRELLDLAVRYVRAVDSEAWSAVGSTPVDDPATIAAEFDQTFKRAVEDSRA